MQFTDAQLARLQGTLLQVKETFDELMSEDSPLDDFTKGYLVGKFDGVPQGVKKSLAILGVVEIQAPEPSPEG